MIVKPKELMSEHGMCYSKAYFDDYITNSYNFVFV